MSNPFGESLAQDSNIGGNEDRLGGFRIHDSNIYPATITLAYFTESDKGARAMNYEVQFDTGEKFSWTEFVTSGKDKGQKNYSEKDGKKSYLPGYLRANAIAEMTVGKPLNQLTFEDKTLKLYSYAAGGEVMTPAKVATELHGNKVYLGIQHVKKNKNVETSTGWKRTAEIKETNEVDKVFHFPSKFTLSEKVEKAEAPEFFDKWLNANKGKVRDLVKPAEVEGAPGQAGAPGAASNDKPTNSLFD